MKLTFNRKLTLVMTIFVVFVGMLLTTVVYTFMKDVVKNQTGDRALAVAESVAHIPSVRAAFDSDDPTAIIQPIVMPIMEATGAQFIVVGNREGIRIAHPIAENIGKPMMGADNDRAFLGESYISESVGSLGESLRGKVPIKNDAGDIVGVVSVGFFIKDIEAITLIATKKLGYMLLLIIMMGIVGGATISYVLKKQLHGLAPDEMVKQFIEKENILQSTQEGVIATNSEGVITLANYQAEKLLGIDATSLVGQLVDKILPQTQVGEVIITGQKLRDYEVTIAEDVLLINAIPMRQAGKLQGVVATFRSKNDMDWLQQELTKTRQYADALRSQTHEFSNKLHVIYGLLQLNEREEAMTMIKQESEISTTIVYRLIDNIADTYISAMLIAKLHVAQEKHIAVVIDDTSELTTKLDATKRHALVTALGNVLDNAMEAVSEQPEPRIYIYFTDISNEIIFEVENSGVMSAGIDTEKIFTRGYTTKEAQTVHGVGLSVSRELLRAVGGDIYVEDSKEDTCFIITMPKGS
ncbi:MAG TPA: sensor histidine kinase [Metalysinibacillus sp.]